MLNFVNSGRNTQKLVVGEFLYTAKWTSKENIKTWRCENRMCTSTVKTQNDTFINEPGAHNHDPITGKTEVAAIRDEIRASATRSEDPPVRIVSRLASNVSLASASQLPLVSSITREIRRIRQSQMNEIPRLRLEQTTEGYPFLRIKHNNLYIFAAATDVEWLSRCVDWFADGTFKTVPHEFMQMYTIHGFDGERTRPCIFALMSRRTLSDYEQLLGNILMLFPFLRPLRIMLDFEQAAITAFQTAFPHATVNGCAFHFNQSLWRSIQRNCLAAQYNTDTVLRNQVSLLFALPYVHPEHVFEAFLMIKQQSTPALANVLKYFERMYVGRLTRRGVSQPSFSHLFWNLSYRALFGIPRTNNAVEGFHNKFRCIIGAPHPPLSLFMRKLSEVQHLNSLPNQTQHTRHATTHNALGATVFSFTRSRIMEYLSDVSTLLHVSQ